MTSDEQAPTVKAFLDRRRSQDLGHAVCVTDADLDESGPSILYVNDHFERLTGYSSGEVVGRSPRLLQGPKTQQPVLDRLRQSLADDKLFQGQTVNYRKDGSEFLMAWSISEVKDSAGGHMLYVAVLLDGAASAAEEIMTEVRRNHLAVLG